MAKARSASDYAALATKIADGVYAAGCSLESGDALTDALQKVAQAEGLTTHQIDRVAHATNQRVFQCEFPKRAGGDVRFEPADPAVVIKNLNAPEKVAADLSDYDRVPDRAVDMDVILRDAFGKVAHTLVPELEKQAAFEQRHGGDDWQAQFGVKVEPTPSPSPTWDSRMTQDMAWRLSKVCDHFEMEQVKIQGLMHEEREKFATIIRRMVTQGHDVLTLYKAATLARPDQKESLQTLFAWVISDMGHKGQIPGHSKTAEPVPPSMISARLDKFVAPVDCMVINGSHPLTLSINILADLATQWNDANKGKAIAQDALDKARKVTTHLSPTRVKGL